MWGILCEKVKQYPVLLNKQLRVYREKDVVTNAWNAVAKERFLLLGGFHYLLLLLFIIMFIIFNWEVFIILTQK